MELYRLEVNPKEIGVEVDTLTRNNIAEAHIIRGSIISWKK